MIALKRGPAQMRGSRQNGAGVDSQFQQRGVPMPKVQLPKVQLPKVQHPMSQQSAFGSHGYDMHPQELLHLSGCQEHSLRERKERGVLLS